MYDQLGATPASTIISTDMEVAREMFNLSMGLPELPATQETSDSVGLTDEILSEDEQFLDMFKVPPKVPPKVLVPQDPPLPRPRLDPQTLMAEAKFKSGCRTLPPPLGLKKQDVADTWNVVLRSMQTPTLKVKDTQVEVADLRNKDPLYLNRDASRDKALQTTQERCRRESHSNSAGSQSSSGKCHQSGSWSRDETGLKRGQLMPMEDWNSPGPVAGIVRPTLDWSQGILEPQKPVWKPAARDTPAMPHQYLKSVVKMLEKWTLAEPAICAKVKPWIKPPPAELASCSRRREIAGMGPAAASWYPGSKELQKKKQVSKKPAFSTLEEQETHRRYEECKNWVVHHQEESISERYTSLKWQAHQYDQEVRALQFFNPNDNVELACKVLAIADWAEEYNQMDIHPILVIPPGLLEPYSGSLQARRQFPRALSEEPRVTDGRTWSQAMWIFLCSILQYFEDDMAAREGTLYGGKTR